MNIKEAYDIVRQFNYLDQTIKPQPIEDIHIVQKRSCHIVYFRLPEIVFNRMISFKKYKEEYLDKKFFKYDKKKLGMDTFHYPKEILYLTSKGLVKEETYFLAQDIMNDTQTIKKKELIESHIYLSSRGKKYIYLGKFRQMEKTEEEKKKLTYSQLKKYKEYLKARYEYMLDISLKKIVNLSSVRLIEHLDKDFSEYTNTLIYLSEHKMVGENYKRREK